jgi:hypothetical protein
MRIKDHAPMLGVGSIGQVEVTKPRSSISALTQTVETQYDSVIVYASTSLYPLRPYGQEDLYGQQELG